MLKKRGKQPPEWIKRVVFLKRRKYATSELRGILVDDLGNPPSQRAIHAAFKRRGIRPAGRVEGIRPESVWSGQKIRDFLEPKQTSLF